MLGAHTCPPRWWCRLYGEDEEDYIIFADSAREAAEEFVLRRDSLNAELSHETHVVVSDDAGNECLYQVEGMLEPAYTARDITGKAAKYEPR
jgi:hypothetical protein